MTIKAVVGPGGTCTVVLAAKGVVCGKPAVAKLTLRDGRTVRECADHFTPVGTTVVAAKL